MSWGEGGAVGTVNCPKGSPAIVDRMTDGQIRLKTYNLPTNSLEGGNK